MVSRLEQSIIIDESSEGKIERVILFPKQNLDQFEAIRIALGQINSTSPKRIVTHSGMGHVIHSPESIGRIKNLPPECRKEFTNDLIDDIKTADVMIIEESIYSTD